MNELETLDNLNIAELQAQFATVSDAVKWYAVKYYGRHCRCEADTDDMLQSALLYAWQHLPSYRPEQGKLSTYVCGAARIACVGWIRSQLRVLGTWDVTGKKRANVSITEARSDDDKENQFEPEARDSSEADVLAEAQEKLWNIVKTFRDNEYIVLEGRLEGLTLKQISNRLGGLSTQRVSQILETVLQKVKVRYEQVTA